MSRRPNIIHIGGEKCVTGSCHLLQLKGLNIMVDCGLTQGHDAGAPMDSWPVRPDQVDFLFLTHAHIDHIGRLPELIQKGFKGEIIATHATKALLAPMLNDAMGFMSLNGHKIAQIENTIDDLSWGFEYNLNFDLAKGLKFKLQPAGHILGSCSIHLRVEDPAWSVLFSGDLGAKDTPILPDPQNPEPADLVVLEATYGDRRHDDRVHRAQRLGRVLNRALADGGKVFIPAFALGRTQELLYEIDRLVSDRQWQGAFPMLNSAGAVPVFVDTPLGLNITKIYTRLSEFWDREAGELYRSGDHPLKFEGLYGVERHKDHRDLMQIPGPAVIIAGSGMCAGGRIVDHLKAGLPQPENDVCFVGYQAGGTPGRDIQRFSGKPGGYAYLAGEKVEIKASIHVLTGYSAHADQNGLVEWVQAMPQKPAAIKLVHGETTARRTLAGVLRGKGYEVI
jgi:metallo-beta-lactamase family protein